jgi:hypothetical protein
VAEAEVVAAEHLGLAQLLQRRCGRGGRRHRAIAGEVREEREWWWQTGEWGGEILEEGMPISKCNDHPVVSFGPHSCHCV